MAHAEHPAPVARPALELADILRACVGSYRETHRLTAQQQRVVNALVSCRTSTRRDMRNHGRASDRQSHDSVKVMPIQTRCEEVALARPSPYSQAFVEVLTEQPSLPRTACRSGPTPTSTSMRLHGSNCIPATSSLFSTNQLRRSREIRFALDSSPGAGCASTRGIAVTRTSSPARAAARHASPGRLA